MMRLGQFRNALYFIRLETTLRKIKITYKTYHPHIEKLCSRMLIKAYQYKNYADQ